MDDKSSFEFLVPSSESGTTKDNSKLETRNAKPLTPLMQQYHELKARYPTEVLLFRLGDFYEPVRRKTPKSAAPLLEVHAHASPADADVRRARAFGRALHRQTFKGGTARRDR